MKELHLTIFFFFTYIQPLFAREINIKVMMKKICWNINKKLNIQYIIKIKE